VVISVIFAETDFIIFVKINTMKKLFVLALCLAFGGFTYAQTDAPKPAAPGVTYGKGTTADKAVTTLALSSALNTTPTFKGKVTGKVVEVCKVKGCFMRLAKDDGSTVVVQFTDYGYFMPQNIVGKTVVVEGEAVLKETSVKDLKHLASDAGKSKEEIAAIKAPKKDISVMADGVLVVD